MPLNMKRDINVNLKLSQKESAALDAEAIDRQVPRTEVLRDYVKALMVKWNAAIKGTE